jgi:hypothetical protein
MPEEKPTRARRRARNSQAPDLFRRAAETDTTLRKSTAGEAPSSRRGAASIGAPSSRRGSQAAKRSRDAAAKSPEEALNSDASDAKPAEEPKSGKISERRLKGTGPDSSSDGAPGRAAVLPGDEVSLAPPAPAERPSRRGAFIGAAIAIAGVAVVLLLLRVGRAPDQPSTDVEVPAAPTQVALTSPTAAPEPSPEVPAPTATAEPEDTSKATTKDGKKKKKKAVTTAKPPATSAPTAPPAPTQAPAFEFKFE